MIRSTVLISALLLAFSSSALAVPITFIARMDGPSESPAVPSPGTGFARVVYDDVARTLAIEAEFADLLGVTTVAHIHAPTMTPGAGTVGVAVTPGTLPGFPAGVTSGTYMSVLDLASTATYTSGFLALGGGTAADAESLLITSLVEGRAYFNIHSAQFPGGEIRGFLQQVPEPSTLALLTLGVLGGVGARRRLTARATPRATAQR